MHLAAEDCGNAMLFHIIPHHLDGQVADQVVFEAIDNAREDRDIYLIDLKQVTAIDSMGLSALVTITKSLGRGRRVELCALSPRVHKVFRLTRMEGVFKIHSSVDAALHANFATRPAAM